MKVSETQVKHIIFLCANELTFDNPNIDAVLIIDRIVHKVNKHIGDGNNFYVFRDSKLFLHYFCNHKNYLAVELFPIFVIEAGEIYGLKKIYKLGKKLFDYMRTREPSYNCRNCGSSYFDNCDCLDNNSI